MVMWTVICNIVAVAISLIVGFFVPTTHGGFGISALLVVAIIGYNLASLRVIGPTELGALLFFGRPISEVKSGLIYAPLGFMTIIRETRLVIQEEYPDDPENVWKGKEEDRKPGKVPPIRITHAGKTDTEDSLERRITSEVSIIVRYRIDDYLTFLTKIGSRREASKQISDSIVSKVGEDLALKTPADTLLKWGDINTTLKIHVESMVANWGITVEDVRLKVVDLGETVNGALRNVPAAELEKQARAIKAEANQIELSKEGEGKANARREFLIAEAVGYKKKLEELGIKDGEIILALEAVTAALKQGNQVVISGSNGLSDLITMGKALTMTKGTTAT